jgi:hypothetical protein
MVELRTVNKLRFVSDNAGVIAIDAPEMMGHAVWFDIIGHGYEVPKDGFGMRGIRLEISPGGTHKVKLRRTILAKRLGRLTGSGLFAESQKLGERLEEPDSPIVGCDSALAAIYHDKLHFAWGDTHFRHYPLGVYHTTSATTNVHSFSKLEPPISLQFNYFLDKQKRPRGVAEMPGSGPTWLTGYTCLKDQHGIERLVAYYRKIRPPLTTYESGLCAWDDATESFQKLKTLWRDDSGKPQSSVVPDGHPLIWKDSAGSSWLMFGNPFPTMKCPATFEAWSDPNTWLKIEPPSLLDSREGQLDSQSGKPDSLEGGQRITPHSGSIAWNSFRRRWVAIFMEKFGEPSAFGELWYAESPEPTGPWSKAIKVLSHDNYTFYNPRIDAEFTTPQSSILLFEGTYTQEFAKFPHPTPRYDYNQILYRLDLDGDWLHD